MKSILSIYIKNFLKEASAAQHGDDDTDFVLADLEKKGYDVSRDKNFKGDFSSTSGYFIEPKNYGVKFGFETNNNNTFSYGIEFETSESVNKQFDENKYSSRFSLKTK